ncbi:MAG TPA: permease-like cell division protein FtsX [Candidatus Limnocylindrales bacterium]|jgi:cell division transport system permease protein
MITFIAFSLRRAWQGLWRNALMTIAATATMVLMLLLLAGFWIIQTGLLAGLEFVEQKVEVVADIRDGVPDSQIADLQARIEEMPDVTSVVYVSREDALARFREQREAQGEEDLSRFLESNPLHASFEIKLLNPAFFDAVYNRLKDEPAIERVKNIQDLVGRVLTVTSFLQTAGGVILIVIGLIVLFIIVNTIRLAVVARSEEIEIMRLVGASDAFIRWPFVFEGALVGLIGSAVTLGVLGAAADPLGQFMFDFFRVLPIEVGTLGRDLVVLVMGTGIGLGILGSWLSVRTYLIR